MTVVRTTLLFGYLALWSMPGVVAQVVDPMGGIQSLPGWVGAGLLGSVLAWLMFVHLPSKDKQFGEISLANQKHVTDVTKTFTENLTAQIATFERTLEAQRLSHSAIMVQVGGHCKEELSLVTDAYRREHDRILEANERFYALLESRFAKSKSGVS